MCGRYTVTASPDALRQRFVLGESIEIRERFNVAPGDDIVTVTTSKEGERRGDILRWGLVPHWAKEPGNAYKTINARAETVAQRPTYRDAFARMRCLIVADGFYEWEKREDGSKQPWWVTLGSGEPFAFAGVWASWRPADGLTKSPPTRIRSCAIITTQANDVLRPIHDRMPVILEPGLEDAWLGAEASGEELQAMLRPLPGNAVQRRAVSKAVNDARYDGPECLADPVGDERRAERAPRLF